MTDSLTRRKLLGGLSGAAVLAAGGGCQRQSSSRSSLVHIATASGGSNMTMSEMLRQEKFLESFDLSPDVIPMADGSKILGGVVSGSIDVAPMSGFGQVFPAMEHGAELKIISAATLVPLLALFSAKGNVRTLKDLEGKIVGVGALGSLVHQLTVTVLRKYSVDISAVRFVSIGSNTDIFKGVMAGTVDAGAGPSSLVEDADLYKVHAVENGNMSVELNEFTYQAGWTSTQAIREKRDVLVRVLAAYAKLFRFLEQPAARESFLRARKTVFPNAAEREHVGEWNFLQKYKPFATDLMFSAERIRYMQQINLDFHIQSRMLPYESVVDLSLARDALKLLA
jgi:ABC-type nitrate/sulfonate/bicarbonate transport system substrate-binding protein